MALETATVARRQGLERERVVLLVAAGAAFLALLDTTVANMAVADVRTDFAGASVAGVTWIITIYAVTFAALLAPAGRVADVVGRRTLMLAGVSLFTAMGGGWWDWKNQTTQATREPVNATAEAH